MVSVKKLAVATLATSIGMVEAVSVSAAVKPYVSQALAFFKLDAAPAATPEIILTFPGQEEKPVPGDSPIIQCDITAPQILELKKVVVTPNPPEKGQNLTFTAVGVLAEDIEDGAYVEVDVRYGFIRLIHQTFDLCEEITKVDLECPIKKGKQIITKEVEIPEEVPPGKYIVNAKAYTKDDHFITCLSATVEFS